MLKVIGLALTVAFGATAAQAAITNNALTTNALTTNALTTNALTTNALTTNALTTNALTNNTADIPVRDPDAQSAPQNGDAASGNSRILAIELPGVSE